MQMHLSDMRVGITDHGLGRAVGDVFNRPATNIDSSHLKICLNSGICTSSSGVWPIRSCKFRWHRPPHRSILHRDLINEYVWSSSESTDHALRRLRSNLSFIIRNSSANSVNQTSDVTRWISWWRNRKPCQHNNRFKWQRNNSYNMPRETYLKGRYLSNLLLYELSFSHLWIKLLEKSQLINFLMGLTIALQNYILPANRMQLFRT